MSELRFILWKLPCIIKNALGISSSGDSSLVLNQQGNWISSGVSGEFLSGATNVIFDGIETVFIIPHNFGIVPSSFAVTFGDASQVDFVQSVRTIDSVNITITCQNPPNQGSQILYWQVFK